jgi:hypothetical protein
MTSLRKAIRTEINTLNDELATRIEGAVRAMFRKDPRTILDCYSDTANGDNGTETKAKAKKATKAKKAVATDLQSAASKPKRKTVKMCRTPGCRKPSKGPRYRFMCEVHRQPAPETPAA